MSRFRTLAMFVAALALAVALGACGGGSSSEEILDEATFKGIESAEVDLSLGVDSEGEKSGHVDVSISGPFQTEAEPELPKLDLLATAKGTANGKKVDFEAGLTLLSGSEAYVKSDGVEYEVDPVTFSYAKSLLRRPGRAGEPAEVTACQGALRKLQVGDFVAGAEDEGSADVGGVSTTKISGDLDGSAAIDALIKISEDPDCSGQLKLASGSALTTERLKKAKEKVQDSVKQGHVELYVGDDHIVRRLAIQTTIEPPADEGSEPASMALDLDLTLTGVNEEQAISAPQSSKPLSALFIKLGVNPIELLGLIEGGSGGLEGLLERLGSAGGSK